MQLNYADADLTGTIAVEQNQEVLHMTDNIFVGIMTVIMAMAAVYGFWIDSNNSNV